MFLLVLSGLGVGKCVIFLLTFWRVPRNQRYPEASGTMDRCLSTVLEEAVKSCHVKLFSFLAAAGGASALSAAEWNRSLSGHICILSVGRGLVSREKCSTYWLWKKLTPCLKAQSISKVFSVCRWTSSLNFTRLLRILHACLTYTCEWTTRSVALCV